jgi:hypothetical protein
MVEKRREGRTAAGLNGAAAVRRAERASLSMQCIACCAVGSSSHAFMSSRLMPDGFHASLEMLQGGGEAGRRHCMPTGLKIVRLLCEIQSTLLRNSGVADHSEGRTIPDISSNCCYKHYPNTLALVGRSLTVDQGPGAMGGSAQRSLFCIRRKRAATGPTATEVLHN